MRYAAVGDSFTEGLGDESADGSPRGWADLVAADLAGVTGEPVHYANLAIRGRLMEPIVTGQLERALAMSPTLVTLNGGGNDMMRPRGDMRALAALTERAVLRCAEAGVRLILLSAADPSDRLPLGRVIRRRATALTAMVADLAEKHGVEFVDVFNDAELRRAGYWSPDRLHLGPEGHRRVADLVLSALGVKISTHTIRAEQTGTPRPVLAELRYYGDHVLPWAYGALRDRSSGGSGDAKHSSWVDLSLDTPGELPQTGSMIPDDDPTRSLTVADPADPATTFVSLVGNTYAMLITGEQTNGRYCLIDMRVPDGGGPPPHRHDFEEMFTILEGEIEFTFRGAKHTVRAGSTVNVPANAPHFFRNVSGAPARMLCMCTPAGQDEYFTRIGTTVDGWDAPPPRLTDDEVTEQRRLAADLASTYRSEFL